MLIDTHAHLNFKAYREDIDEVIKRTLDNDVWIINIGSQYETNKRAVEIADGYEERVYAAIGLHPLHLEEHKLDKSEVGSLSRFKTRAEEFDYERYKELAQSEKVVAVGEIGFDYYYKPKTKRKLEIFKQKQKETFLKQLKLAQELNLPAIFHCRMAHDDLIQTIQQSNIPTLKGVIHCFTGNWEQAKKYLGMGFLLGFNGIIFKLNLDEIIKNTPLDKILMETDCPYLSPPPFEGQRNEPLYIKYVVEKIAKIKNLSYGAVARQTTYNAKTLFGI